MNINFFFARNNLRYFFLNCIPESEKELCRSIVKYIQNDDEELQEEICETIQQLNIHDIKFIDIVNAYKKSDFKNKYDMMKTNIEAAMKSGDKYQDRNFIYSNNTVFIEDLNNFIGIPKSSVVDMLNEEFMVNKHKTLDVFYFGKSIIKLQSLGILQTDFITTLGTSSTNNIDRIHITQLGQKLFECFEVASEGENLMKKE